jgi:uncharacterized membrane protein YfcA
MVGAATILAIVGIVLSIYLHEFLWFARFGSVITFIGIVLFNRPRIIRQDLLPDVQMAETGLSSHDPEHYRRVQEPIPPAVVDDQRSRRALSFAIWITLGGTIIWGFGELLNSVFGFSHR